MPDAKITRTLRRLRFTLILLGIFFASPRFTDAQDAATKSPPQNPSKRQSSVCTTLRLRRRQTGTRPQPWKRTSRARLAGFLHADGDVDLRYQNTRLRADHVEYNNDTQVAIARGHVQLDYMNQHVEADEAHYELRTGHGTFFHVRATFSIDRHPAPTLLISPNPLYFEAEEAERLDEHTYRIKKAWMTVCDPDKPTWKFYAPEATVYLQKSVHLENGDFRVFSVPVLYLPYATFPAGKERESGFMIPNIGDSSSKGYILGESYYWAPTDWMDASDRRN